MGFRQERVNSLLMETISEILEKEVMDPRIGLITVTYAKTSPDLKNTTVYFMVHGGEKEGNRNAKLLNHASGFFQHEIAKRIKLRYIPRIQFKYDRSLDRIKRIESLLKEESSKENEKSD